MNTKKLLQLFALVSAAGLSACGGGGSSAPAPSAAAPTPAAAPAPATGYASRQPVTSVPAPTYFASSFQLSAFNRLNALRASVGLGLFTQNASLDGSAQAHANYVKSNGIGNGHLEAAGLTGFTGVNPGDRMVAAGYSLTAGSEDIGFTGAGVAAVDDLTDAVYHRIPFLSFKLRDIGVGFVQTSTDPNPAFNTYANVLNMGYIGTGQGAPALTSVVWPADNSTTTSTSMPSESPRPGTPGASGVFGYPVSISVDEDRAVTVTTFTLTDNTGATVLCNLLSNATDTNLAQVTLSPKSFVALVPRDPLKPAATYTVQFVGAIDGVAYSKTWSFKTP